MSSQLIPVNQLNALPLITAAQAATAGTVQVVGGSVYRSFTPAQLGINATSVASDPGGIYYLATPFLDLRGCSKVTVTLQRTVSANGALLPQLKLYGQTRQGPADAMPIAVYPTAGNFSSLLSAMILTTSDAAQGIFQAQLTTDVPQRCVWAFSFSQSGSSGSGDSFGGANTRFVWSPLTNAIAATNLFTAYLEAWS